MESVWRDFNKLLKLLRKSGENFYQILAEYYPIFKWTNCSQYLNEQSIRSI